MANKVFANTREIACKAAAGKTICAFPDVCFTPPDKVPPTPPGVPIPYPNTGMASDTTKGSKKVMISDEEIILKNKSYFKKSTGDEAGCATKKGVITSKTKGKVYFQAWSMDVKIEGQNAARHLDITTNNHASTPGDTPPWPYMDTMSPPPGQEKACEKEKEREEKACKSLVARRDTKRGPSTGAILKGKTKENICADTDDAKKCRQAQKCKLVPQKEGCCPGSGEQAHHIVEAHGFYEKGSRDNLSAKALPEFDGYQPGDAPCVCAEGGRGEKEHGAFHAFVGKRENRAIKKAMKSGGDTTRAWTYGDSKKAGVDAHRKIFPKSKCSKSCLEAQLDSYHSKAGVDDSSPVRTDSAALQDWQKKSDTSVLQAMNDQMQSNAGTGVLG